MLITKMTAISKERKFKERLEYHEIFSGAHQTTGGIKKKATISAGVERKGFAEEATTSQGLLAMVAPGQALGPEAYAWPLGHTLSRLLTSISLSSRLPCPYLFSYFLFSHIFSFSL